MMFTKTAVLGAGTIGASWAALFAATGREVTVYDPAPDAEARVARMVEAAADPLAALGWEGAGDLSRIRYTADPADAVIGAGFVQESVPERLEIKHTLYARIEPVLEPGTIVASSTSGLMLGQMQDGFANPGRLVLAHPFNPPHLIPLVELMGNGRTDADVLDTAQKFYEDLGKVCIRLHKEVPGHVANRLQAALWREAIHLAAEGVASVADIDRAIAHGPGLRWAIMGPSLLFHLAGGEGGMRNLAHHLGPAFETWWADLGTAHLTPDVVEMLVAGVEEEAAGRSVTDLAGLRDRVLLSYLKARAGEV